MKYTKLGNSDLTVSRICMGCMGFGEIVGLENDLKWASEWGGEICPVLLSCFT